MSGRRRLDHILEDDYLEGLRGRSTDEIRRMRDECEEEETTVSYARRILQGKLDILRAEAERRRGERDPDADSVLERVPELFGNDQRTPLVHARPVRHLIPPEAGLHQRELDRLAADDVLATLPDRATADLVGVAERLSEAERRLSDLRWHLLRRLDTLQEELIRRYKSGEAHPRDVLVGPDA